MRKVIMIKPVETVPFVSNLGEKNHDATVIELNGNLQFLSQDIITPKGISKVNKLISVIPDPQETVTAISDSKYVFSALKQMNLILTNACNLACTYCYEQHNKDFGRFTNESLLKAYRFLKDANINQRKVFQFFGGEPLIHKDIILDFLKNNKEELDLNSRGENNTVVSIVTNGLLLSQPLVEEYFSYDFTFMLISLDTDKANVDHREIGQDKIDKLMDQIKTIPELPKSQKRVTIRCTLARENSPYFAEFVDRLYERGIRRLIVHPLVLDSARGFIKWSEEEWGTLHHDILNSLEKYQDLQIHFSEGVGKKGEENCMIGSDMIAIDASGDFSGCYFFTNQKAGVGGPTILGNILQDKIYLDRYKTFQKEYAKMFEEEEQCKTCDYKNSCYQCPAGNLDTGSRMFRPDDMCQKIVKLYVDLQEDIAKKQFKLKYEVLVKALDVEGYELTFLKAISYMLFYHIYQYHPLPKDVHDNLINRFKTPQTLLGFWNDLMHGKYASCYDIESDKFLDTVEALIKNSNPMNIDDFYYSVLKKRGMPTGRIVKVENKTQEVFFLTLLHVLILMSEDPNLDDAISDKLLY